MENTTSINHTRERVTIHSVAKEAGVSASTVSRVLTGNGAVREDLRAVVLQAVEKLAYRPNQVARSLKVRETRTLGLLIDDILNPFYSSVAKGVEDRARIAGYSVIFVIPVKTASSSAMRSRCCTTRSWMGSSSAPIDMNNFELLQNLLAMGMNLVQIDRQLPQG